MDVNEELKFLCKFKKKKKWGGSGGWGWGGGQGGWERIIEVFVKIQKKKNILFFFWGGGRGGGWGGGVFVILHLQNCTVKFQKFQRAITQKRSY